MSFGGTDSAFENPPTTGDRGVLGMHESESSYWCTHEMMMHEVSTVGWWWEISISPPLDTAGSCRSHMMVTADGFVRTMEMGTNIGE
jgi:hypothetical protein